MQPGLMGTPVLTVPLSVWQKMFSYVHACPVEVNGFGYVTRRGLLDFELDDVFILEQTATAASVDVSELTIANHMTDMMMRGEDTGRMRFQWHSHVRMSAYFSGTDTSNIDRYPGDWMLSLVANKYGQFEARLDVFAPFRLWAPLEVRIIAPLEDEMARRAKAEISQKVRMPGYFRDKPVRADSVPAMIVLDGEILREDDSEG